FEADAGLVTPDYDRALHDGRFHDASSPSIRCWSSKSLARSVRRSSRTRSDLVRPNRARLLSACLADRSRSMRFLNLFRLTTSPMLASIMQQMKSVLLRNRRCRAQSSFRKSLLLSSIASKNVFRSAKAKYFVVWHASLRNDDSGSASVFRYYDL